MTNGEADLPLQRKLSYRLAETDRDYDLLHDMRLECGWGADRLMAYRADPDRVLCILSMQAADYETVDVGMGGWVLDMPKNQQTASREQGIVYLTSLFIYKKYQGLGLGTLAIDLLERTAAETFNAKKVTLDAIAYHLTHGPNFEDLVEHTEIISRNRRWYSSRGYVMYRPVAPMFPDPAEPGRMLHGVVMEKIMA